MQADGWLFFLHSKDLYRFTASSGNSDDDDDDGDDDDDRGSEGRSCIRLTNHCSRGRFVFKDLITTTQAFCGWRPN